MKTRRKLALAVLTTVGMLGVGLTPGSAAPQEGVSLVGVHPDASVETTATARTLWDLAVVDGSLVAGYGDWNSNTGPVTINALDLATLEWSGPQLEVPTEALQNVRVLEGGQYDGTYFPLTDPRTSQWANSGFVTAEPWTLHEVAPAIHVFDVAQRGNELWMVGSAWDTSKGSAHGAATAYRTTDGVNWELMRSEFDSNDNRQSERYYWAAELDGKVYMQAEHIDAPVRYWDGRKWGSTKVKVEGYRVMNNPGSICGTGNGKDVISFGGNILCPWADGTMVFNGKKGYKAKGWPYDRTIRDGSTYYTSDVEDWFVDGDYLYALSSRGHVARSLDGLSWQVLIDEDERLDTASTSLAVHDDYLYYGAREGEVYRVNESITSLATDAPVESPPNSGGGPGNNNGGGPGNNNGGGNNGSGPNENSGKGGN